MREWSMVAERPAVNQQSGKRDLTFLERLLLAQDLQPWAQEKDKNSDGNSQPQFATSQETLASR